MNQPMILLLKDHFNEIYLRAKGYAAKKGHPSPEDAAAQAITEALSNHKEFQGNLESLVKYIIGILHYDIIDHYRDKARKTITPFENKNIDIFFLPSYNDTYFEHQHFLDIIKMIDSLTPAEIKCLAVKYLYDYSDKESSEILNYEPTTLRSRRSEALRKIRKVVAH